MPGEVPPRRATGSAKRIVFQGCAAQNRRLITAAGNDGLSAKLAVVLGRRGEHTREFLDD